MNINPSRAYQNYYREILTRIPNIILLNSPFWLNCTWFYPHLSYFLILRVSPHHDKVYKANSVQWNIPVVHHSHDVDEDHKDCDEYQSGGPDVQPRKSNHHQVHSEQRDEQAEENLLPHRQILLVVNVEYAVQGENYF